MKRVAFLAILAGGLVATSCGQEKGPFNSYLGKAPPELKVAPGGWITSQDPPELGKLRGKVVWLEFSFTT